MHRFNKFPLLRVGSHLAFSDRMDGFKVLLNVFFAGLWMEGVRKCPPSLLFMLSVVVVDGSC